jgi:hypothetical protein
MKCLILIAIVTMNTCVNVKINMMLNGFRVEINKEIPKKDHSSKLKKHFRVHNLQHFVWKQDINSKEPYIICDIVYTTHQNRPQEHKLTVR